MAVAVVVFSDRSENTSIRSDAADGLARLGVTNVAVVGHDEMTAVVLEGWAFEPAACATEVTALVGHGRGCTLLRPLLQMSVSAGSDDRSGVR